MTTSSLVTYSFGDSSLMFGYASARTAATEAYIIRLGQLASSLVPPVITPVFPSGGSAPAISVDPVPTTNNIIWTAPGIPAPFTGTLNVDAYFPEPFDEDPPNLVFGAAPAAPTDPVPDAPPIDLNFVYPNLNVSLPAPPSLLQIQTHTFNGITMPTIDTTAPVLTAVAPSIVPYTPGSQYTSSLLTALQTTLQARITTGGTGLSPTVENAIWDRAREREYRQQADALAALDRDSEVLGYAYPPGAFNDSRIKIQTETNYTIAGLSRDIMIKQAELEQTNVLKALDSAIVLESKLIDNNNEVERRVFEASKYATEAGIAIYNAQVQAFTAFVDAYKAKIAIYEAQIRAELAEVEVFKTEIEAEKVKADINTALVTQYRVQVDAALSAVEIFKSEIEAIRARAEVEKIKVETFGEQVRAHMAKVNIYTAQVEGFKASLQAETTKQEAYRSQVEAFNSLVTAAAKQVDARIAEFQGRLAAKSQEYDAYRALVQGQGEQARALAAANSSIADIYKARVTGTASYNETLTKQWQAALDQAQRVTEIGVSAAKANAELFMTTRSLALDSAKVGAQVEAQLGAAALSAINWSTSLGYSKGESDSNSTSQSSSTSTNTNFNFSA